MAKQQSVCKSFCTIQIKVTVSTPQIPSAVRTLPADPIYMWAECETFLQNYSTIPSGLYWVMLRKYPQCSILNAQCEIKRDICTPVAHSQEGGIKFCMGPVSVYSSKTMTGQRPNTSVYCSVLTDKCITRPINKGYTGSKVFSNRKIL